MGWNWVWELTKAFFKFNLWKDPSRKIQLCSKPHILGGMGERSWSPKTDLGTSTWVVPSGYFEGQQRWVLRSIWWSFTSKPPPSVSLSLVTYWIVFLALPVQFQVFIKENRQNGRGRQTRKKRCPKETLQVSPLKPIWWRDCYLYLNQTSQWTVCQVGHLWLYL